MNPLGFLSNLLHGTEHFVGGLVHNAGNALAGRPQPQQRPVQQAPRPQPQINLAAFTHVLNTMPRGLSAPSLGQRPLLSPAQQRAAATLRSLGGPINPNYTSHNPGFGATALEAVKGIAQQTPVLSDAIKFGQQQAARDQANAGHPLSAVNPLNFTKQIGGVGYNNSPLGAAQRTVGRTIATVTGKPVNLPVTGQSQPLQKEVGNATPILGNKLLGQLAAGGGVLTDALYGKDPLVLGGKTVAKGATKTAETLAKNVENFKAASAAHNAQVDAATQHLIAQGVPAGHARMLAQGGQAGFINTPGKIFEKPLNPTLPDAVKVKIDNSQKEIESIHSTIAAKQNELDYGKEQIDANPQIPVNEKDTYKRNLEIQINKEVNDQKRALADHYDNIDKLDPSGKSRPFAAQASGGVNPGETTLLDQQLAQDAKKPNIMQRIRNQGGSINFDAKIGGKDEVLPKGEAIWSNGETDMPIHVTGSLGKDASGREFYSIKGSNTGIPADEVKFAQSPKQAPIAAEKTNRAPQSLNTDRLNISEDAKGEVNALSQADPVTHMTDKEVQDLAKSSGLDLRSHSIDQTRQKVAEQLNLRQKIVTVTNRADQLLADGNLGERAQLLRQIQELSRTSTEQGTDIARQLSARRILANELDSPIQRVFKLLDKEGVNPDVVAEKFAGVDFNDSNAVVKAFRELVPPTKMNWLDTVRYNSMLSSPLTQINNIFPNIESTAMITPIEKTLTGLLDVAHSALTGKPRQFAVGEGKAYAKGYFSSVGEAKRRFSDSLSGKTEATNLDTKGNVPMYAHGQNKTYDVLSFPMRMMEAMDGFFTGLTEGGVTKALEHRQSVGIKIANQGGLPERPTQKQVEAFAIGRKVSPSDRNNVGTITAINHDAGTATLSFKSKEGATATKSFPFSEIAGLKTLRKSTDGYTSSAPDVLKNTAEAESAYRLYRQELGDKSQGKFLQAMDIPAQKLMELRNSPNKYVSLPAKFTEPFVRTTMNIFKQGFEYSPAGVLTLHGSQNKTEQLSKMLLGTAVVGTAGAMLGHNRLTWAQPTNPKQLEAWKAAGMQPYSVKIGNNWISFQKLPPAISFNLALVAALDDAQKNSKINQNGVDNVMGALAKYGQFLSDQSYTKSAGNFLKAVQGDPQAATQLASGYPQQLIPYRALLNWVATMTDTTQRKINTDANFAGKQLEALMQVIPGLREKTTTVKDPNGVDVAAQHPVLNAFSPLKVSTENAPGADYYNSLKQTALDNSNKRITNKQDKAAGTTIKGNVKLAPNLSSTSKTTLTNYANLDSAGKAKFNADPKNKYALNQAQYEQNKLSGKLNGPSDLKAQQSLAKEAITSKYSQDVLDFYGLSKSAMNDYFKQNPQDAKKLYDQAKQLDAQLGGGKFKNGLAIYSGRGKNASKPKKLPKLALKQVHLSKAPKIKVAKAKTKGFKLARSKSSGTKISLTA